MATASSPVLVQGQYLWKDGERFLVRGVVCQAHDSDDFSLGGRDIISDDRIAQLQDDVRLFQELGLNTIYVYSIDYAKAHAKAMKLLEEAGIYVLVNLSTPHHCINRMDPYGSYNPDNLSAFFKTVDAIASFPNTLGVMIADHLINNADSERCTPVIKAVVQDLKRHMRLRHQACGQRSLPIGFGGGSYKYDRKILNYMLAGDEDSCVDFWTCTGFEWKAKSDPDGNGYNHVIEKYRSISIPIIMSEYGIGDTTKSPRRFDETTALYSPSMTETFSGGCAYELWQGHNTFGLALLERNLALSRRSAPRPGRIAERRETELGTLLLFEDFMNYKARLAEVLSNSASLDKLPAKRQAGLDTHGPLSEDVEIESKIPESCVDWSRIEEELSNDVRTA